MPGRTPDFAQVRGTRRLTGFAGFTRIAAKARKSPFANKLLMHSATFDCARRHGQHRDRFMVPEKPVIGPRAEGDFVAAEGAIK